MSIEEIKMVAAKAFVPGDYHIVLTFRKPKVDLYEATHLFEQFEHRIYRLCVRYNKPFKLIVTAHAIEGNSHLHVLVPRLPIDEIKEAWPYGVARCSELNEEMNDSDYTELVQYMFQTNKKGTEVPYKLIIEEVYRN